MKTRAAAVTAASALAAAAVLAGCHGSSGSASSGSAAASARAAVSAAATSTAVAAAEADAKAYFARCIPASAAGQVQLVTSLGTSSGRQSLMGCAGVPGPERKAAEACALGNLEKAGTPPKGTAAKLGWLLTAAYPCAVRYQGAPAAPSASAS